MAGTLIPNSDITIYNKYIENRAEKYQRSEIVDVVWQSTKAVSQMRTQTATNKALILIPFAQGTDYQQPKAWQSDRVGWTLQEGDFVVRGIVTDEITSLYTVDSLHTEHDDVFIIASVDAMDEGSPAVQHWELNCK